MMPTGYTPPVKKICVRCGLPVDSCLYTLCLDCRQDDIERDAELHRGPLDQEIFGFDTPIHIDKWNKFPFRKEETMRLKPNDILQEGDILKQLTMQERVGEIHFGKTAAEYMKHMPFPECVVGIERPDPTIDYAAQVKILRVALEDAMLALEGWKITRPGEWDNFDRSALNNAIITLEATK